VYSVYSAYDRFSDFSLGLSSGYVRAILTHVINREISTVRATSVSRSTIGLVTLDGICYVSWSYDLLLSDPIQSLVIPPPPPPPSFGVILVLFGKTCTVQSIY